jgi:molybdopterin-guanine dinucleotide biosynthesis protein A
VGGHVPAAAAGDGAPALQAAILAGGAGTRMGTPKAAVELAGRPLISYPIAAARLAGLAPFVVAKRGSELPELDCPVVIEPDEPTHALTGIVSALERTGAPLVVLACDLPLVPPELIAELGHRRAGFAMPDYPRPQPLVARYTPGLLPQLRAGLAESRSLTEVTGELGGDGLSERELRGFGSPEQIFANVNDRDELTRMEATLAQTHLKRSRSGP